MSYTTGSAASFAAVKTALVNACVADGWTNTADAGGAVVLSKSGVFVQVVDTIDGLAFLGRTSLDAGNAPNACAMGDITIAILAENSDVVSFPLTYHVFTFTNEVFLVIGYGGKYQWATFGLSPQAGLTGSGAFVGASCGSTRSCYYNVATIGDTIGGGYSHQNSSLALFWNTKWGFVNQRNCFVHSNIDPTYPWDLGLTTSSDQTGVKYMTELIRSQPNSFNSESVFIPIRAYKERTDGKSSQVIEVANARHIRVDNYNNEQIITLGLDKWMVFPWYRKNTAVRNGSGTAQSVNHTGTFGWAIKYEGP
jgi:hypothetical protein